MKESKFDDTRSSIEKLIEVFFWSEKEYRFRDKRFEKFVIQVINRKSAQNFELFAYAFDFVFNNKITIFEDFEKLIRNNKLKQNKDLYKLYFEAENIRDRHETIELAIEIYQHYLRMIKSFYMLYRNSKNEAITIKKQAFDEKFFEKGYLFLDVSFDIFLSHKYYLKFYNIIVYYILTVFFDLVVYVDWIFDHNVDRKKLSEDTVRLLKYRMNQSKKLLFFNISNSNTTNWMAWEVGYFSCLRENSIGILDLDGYCKGNKNVEVLSSNEIILFDKQIGLYLKKNGLPIKKWVYR